MKKTIIAGKWHGKRYYKDEQAKTFKTLINELKNVHSEYNVIGIKQSFEDEGAQLDDVLTMRRVTELCNLSMYVKIGGCEAITDINNCVNMGINNLIAPMVETEYAFKKFITSVKNIKNTNFYFLCETKDAYKNLDKILDSEEASYLSGVILGRSDFTKSFELDKNETDSEFIMEKVKDVFTRVKNKNPNLITTMGGNISINSSNNIKSLYEKGILDKIESRNVVVQLNDKNIKNFNKTISAMLSYEISWLEFKAINYDGICNSYMNRISTLKKRIE
jgi:4-hydroxy-2-oxoheptanedioate aldolase